MQYPVGWVLELAALIPNEIFRTSWQLIARSMSISAS
jgi:hypothetical protein